MCKIININKFGENSTSAFINKRLVEEGYDPIDDEAANFIISMFIEGEIKILERK
jgi:hypothetical protein